MWDTIEQNLILKTRPNLLSLAYHIGYRNNPEALEKDGSL